MTDRRDNQSPTEPAEGATSLGDLANAAAGSDSNMIPIAFTCFLHLIHPSMILSNSPNPPYLIYL